ncbi:P-loop containing nucleoside triphosphate hydrolase protein [Cokeromyces recurvatus]|uniref:P-loop containing nucleoside triphosphate hydrolase protein n=1 Tax=Cokeromyces recurvatus TaxID=90255 RepID=UPI00221F969D|nr:P-loop containing nucleoside triphosphate hydrolase protein [Cokeromyces recurvatus]KAI7898604.1 P-loop containing nucleoside triphosphate hydrolase protein [Cokeromyces recurvatus]
MLQNNRNKKSSISLHPPCSNSSTRGTVGSPKLTGRRSFLEKGTNVQVMLRFKGSSSVKKLSSKSSILETVDSNAEDKVLFTPNNTIYNFDRVFKEEATQQGVYNAVAAPILSDVLNGYSCTIFAYGQTGTGKTYTMEGDLGDSDEYHEKNAGIIPRTIQNLFQRLGTLGQESHVMVSMLELYNEELRDLLCASDEHKALNIFEDGTGVRVQNIKEHLISSASQGLTILKSGIKKRMTAATNCNEKSSRSHSIFTITVYMKCEESNSFRIGKLNLVDLAGSENSKSSGSENLRAREAASINRSLLTLGRVINGLVDKTPHIPYRESKLTRLLKDSLGGQMKTCIIATVSPANQTQEEVRSTLDYASHAKGICNRPQANSPISHERHVHVLVKTIEQLQEELRVNYEKSGVYQTKKAYDATRMEMQEMKDTIKALQITNEELQQAERYVKQETSHALEQMEAKLKAAEESLAAERQEKEALAAQLQISEEKLEEIKKETNRLHLEQESKNHKIRQFEMQEVQWSNKMKDVLQKYKESVNLVKSFKNQIMQAANTGWDLLIQQMKDNSDKVISITEIEPLSNASTDIPEVSTMLTTETYSSQPATITEAATIVTGSSSHQTSSRPASSQQQQPPSQPTPPPQSSQRTTSKRATTSSSQLPIPTKANTLLQALSSTSASPNARSPLNAGASKRKLMNRSDGETSLQRTKKRKQSNIIP